MKSMENRRARRNMIVGGSLSAIAAMAVFATPSARAHDGDEGPTGVYEMTDADIEALRTATAPYANSEDAVAAGRIDVELCFDMMGHHFADPATFGDGILDPTAPEALVYADVDGARQLVAVEWVSTAPGEVLGIPLHLNHDLDVWILHAWIGLDNASGMHADHNPDVGTCPAA